MHGYRLTVEIGMAPSTISPSPVLTSLSDDQILPNLAGFRLCIVKAVTLDNDDEPTYNIVCAAIGERSGLHRGTASH